MKIHNFTLISLFILILSLIAILLSNNPFIQTESLAHIQESPKESQMQWNRTYRGPNDDYCTSLIQTSDGGFALAGVTNLSDFGSISNMWLIKTDANGLVEWDQTFGGEKADGATSLIQTPDKGFALVGYSSLFGSIWLLKTDIDGAMQWNQTYWQGYASTLLQTSDGGYAIVGSKSNKTSLGYSRIAMFLIKTDAIGVEQWNQTYGGIEDDYANSFTLTDDGGFALAGGTRSYSNETMDMWLVKTDSHGIVFWNQTYGGIGYDRAYAVLQTRDGGFILAGETNSYGAGEHDMYLVKTDANGLLQWNKTYGGVDRDEAFSLIQTNDNGFAIAGHTASYGVGEADMWLIKTDVNGVLQWNQTFGGTDWDYASTVIQTSDGGFALAGRIESYGDSDMWLVKTYGNSVVDKFTSGFTVIPFFLAIFPLITLLNNKRKK